MSKRSAKKTLRRAQRGNAEQRLRAALARCSKEELIDILSECARADRAALRRIAAHVELPTSPNELVQLTREAIAEATAFDERDINRNFDYDVEAYREVQHNLQRLIELKQLRPAMELSLELMAAGSYQVEASDEGLMTDDIKTCLSAVLETLRRCELPPAEIRAWCTAMIKRDRVGFVCDQELRALRKRFKA
ncbi:MAG: hypothetical protein AB1716_19455 [Planctomycetota bacterium]